MPSEMGGEILAKWPDPPQEAEGSKGPKKLVVKREERPVSEENRRIPNSPLKRSGGPCKVCRGIDGGNGHLGVLMQALARPSRPAVRSFILTQPLGAL